MSVRGHLTAVGAAIWLSLCGCGGFDVDPGNGGGGGGRVCYQDSDCVPDGCCGTATDAIHIDDAPDCTGQVCTGSCPADMIDCGCAIPVCRENHCTKAVTYNDRCQ